MKILTMLFILKATLILLHEIESACEREWKMFPSAGFTNH
jgi:hypothetical protein